MVRTKRQAREVIAGEGQGRPSPGEKNLHKDRPLQGVRYLTSTLVCVDPARSLGHLLHRPGDEGVRGCVIPQPPMKLSCTVLALMAIARGDPASPSPRWVQAAALPVALHDVSGAVIGGKLYVAGGAMTDWGPPQVFRAYREVWCLDPESGCWSVAATLAHPRIYAATVAFQGKVWVVGGDIIDDAGVRRSTLSVDIVDPVSGRVSSGPSLPAFQPAPLGLVTGGRLYVMGASDRSLPGRVDSLGAGETRWKPEPAGPVNMWALAGAERDGLLYVCVPASGLWSFDPARGSWSHIGGPTAPRSPEVVSWRGEIWIIGGRDLADPTQVEIFEPGSGRWRLAPPIPEPLAWGAAAVVGDRIHVVGGAAGTRDPARPFVFSNRTWVLR